MRAFVEDQVSAKDEMAEPPAGLKDAIISLTEVINQITEANRGAPVDNGPRYREDWRLGEHARSLLDKLPSRDAPVVSASPVDSSNAKMERALAMLRQAGLTEAEIQPWWAKPVRWLVSFADSEASCDLPVLNSFSHNMGCLAYLSAWPVYGALIGTVSMLSLRGNVAMAASGAAVFVHVVLSAVLVSDWSALRKKHNLPLWKDL